MNVIKKVKYLSEEQGTQELKTDRHTEDFEFQWCVRSELQAPLTLITYMYLLLCPKVNIFEDY